MATHKSLQKIPSISNRVYCTHLRCFSVNSSTYISSPVGLLWILYRQECTRSRVPSVLLGSLVSDFLMYSPSSEPSSRCLFHTKIDLTLTISLTFTVTRHRTVCEVSTRWVSSSAQTRLLSIILSEYNQRLFSVPLSQIEQKIPFSQVKLLD